MNDLEQLQAAGSAVRNAKSAQRHVYDAVVERGYTDGWDSDQLAARQVCKLVEELGELAEGVQVSLAPTDAQALTPSWKMLLHNAAGSARQHFDTDLWHNVDVSALSDEEIADLQVILFTLAETRGIDVVALAQAKAERDVGRGVRSEMEVDDG